MYVIFSDWHLYLSSQIISSLYAWCLKRNIDEPIVILSLWFNKAPSIEIYLPFTKILSIASLQNGLRMNRQSSVDGFLTISFFGISWGIILSEICSYTSSLWTSTSSSLGSSNAIESIGLSSLISSSCIPSFSADF